MKDKKAKEGDGIIGKNGVFLRKSNHNSERTGYRTYEVYQRERVGESTEKIKPSELISEEYRIDPYPFLETLRENYPCYRDWLSNCYWITKYNDVTSIFSDDANFETRPKNFFLKAEGLGKDLGNELPVLFAQEKSFDDETSELSNTLVEELLEKKSADLATEFAAVLPLKILSKQYGVTDEESSQFAHRYWRMQRGTSWDPKLQVDGKNATQELIIFFADKIRAGEQKDMENCLSAMIELGANEKDVVATLLNTDHETMHGALSNLWFTMLTSPEKFEEAKSSRRMLKLAYLETLRHSPPVLSAERFALREVERFGRLIPEGAKLICSAAAANRDPQIFKNPEEFIVDRRDMCQREPRGQYRADGLASGIAFALGKPSIHPAVPENRPRSKYAIIRDAAVSASQILIDSTKDIKLKNGETPHLSSLTVGEMHTCWKLPVELQAG
ncbi:MAG: hypothetical protein CMQ27_00680 [Gammaproteobacteria bacterium]|nr:hypothetical protein [Gammaproteobacteria bacterium]